MNKDSKASMVLLDQLSLQSKLATVERLRLLTIRQLVLRHSGSDERITALEYQLCNVT